MSEEQRTITDADLKALAAIIEQNHACRFDNVSRADMDFVKDLLGLYKETRSEIIKWAVKGILYGALIVIGIGLYVKFGGKH